MKKVTETYYMSSDGKKFKNENECEEYEKAKSKVKEIKEQIKTLNRELARAEYVLRGGGFIDRVVYAGGNGHDGYYNKCPHCGELVGGWEGRNTFLKVDACIYKCEKCGQFFKYS